MERKKDLGIAKLSLDNKQISPVFSCTVLAGCMQLWTCCPIS